MITTRAVSIRGVVLILSQTEYDMVKTRAIYPISLSKSKYLSGLQCHKLLWHYYNAKNEIPEVDAATQAIFDQGHLVGEYAKKLFPDGIEVAKDVEGFDEVLKQSSKALALRKPLFEAAFKSNNAYARADILNPVGKDQWDIIEVKSSTEVKDINLHDLALQRFAYEGAGLKIAKCFILHINNEYVRHGEIEPKKLFKQVDVTNEVSKLSSSVAPNLKEMLRVIGEKKFPEVEIGPHCNDPYGCPLQEKCWAFLPENNPLTLYYFKKEKAFELIHSGTLDILPYRKRETKRQAGNPSRGAPKQETSYRTRRHQKLPQPAQISSLLP